MSELAELHSRLPIYKRRLAEAEDIISAGLNRCQNPYLACSFGKDSAAMLHLVLRFAPEISVRFLKWTNESDYLNDYGKVIEEWQARFKINLEIIELRRESFSDKVKNRWQVIEKEADGYFIGLRGEEHKNRRMTLKMHGVVYLKKDGLTRISPLAWWKTIDVQTYIETNNLPMLSAYKAEGFEARTASRIPRASVLTLALTQLKQRDLTAFNELKKNFPEISNYV